MAARRADDLYESIRAAYYDERRRFLIRVGRHDAADAAAPRRPAPRWDGGEDADGRFHKPVWPKIAKFAADNGVSPFDLLRAAFASWHGMSPPEPSRIYSEWGLSLAREWRAKLREKAAFDLKDNGNRARGFYLTFTRQGEEDPIKAWRQVIYSHESMLSALYRHCMAACADFQDLAAQYEDMAFDEYVWGKEVYDEVWGDWIPDALRRRAEELHTQMEAK